MPLPTLNSEEPLNAPFGARCFLTSRVLSARRPIFSLNAPFGARCFLTVGVYSSAGPWGQS